MLVRILIIPIIRVPETGLNFFTLYVCGPGLCQGDRKGYKFWKSNPDKLFSADEMITLFDNWAQKYPIVSIEDPLDQVSVHFCPQKSKLQSGNFNSRKERHFPPLG